MFTFSGAFLFDVVCCHRLGCYVTEVLLFIGKAIFRKLRKLFYVTGFEGEFIAVALRPFVLSYGYSKITVQNTQKIARFIVTICYFQQDLVLIWRKIDSETNFWLQFNSRETKSEILIDWYEFVLARQSHVLCQFIISDAFRTETEWKCSNFPPYTAFTSPNFCNFLA